MACVPWMIKPLCNASRTPSVRSSKTLSSSNSRATSAPRCFQVRCSDRSDRAQVLKIPQSLRSFVTMKGQLAGLMKQAQQMQEEMQKKQQKLALIEVEGTAGAGLVKVVMSCNHEVRRVSIDPVCWTKIKRCLKIWLPLRLMTRCARPAQRLKRKSAVLRARYRCRRVLSCPAERVMRVRL